MKIDFLTPHYLWLLLILPIFILFLWLNDKRRNYRLASLGSLAIEKNRSKNSLSHQMLSLIPLSLIIISIARPYSGSESIKLPREGGDTMLLIDVSRSMLAKDIKGTSRIDFVKRKILDLIRLIEKKIPGERLGLVLFAGESYLYCPLTEDYSVLSHYTKSMGPDLITSTGSAIFDGVNTAINSLREVKARSPRILLFSDGEDNSIKIDSIISLSREHKIPIDLIGIGTSDGAPIELSDGSFIKDRRGNIVISKLNDSSLEKIANQTGGKYLRFSLTDQDLEEIFKDREINKTSSTEYTREITIYNEIGRFLLLGAIIFVLISSYMGAKQTILYSSIIIAFIIPIKAKCQTKDNSLLSSESDVLSLNQAYHAYNNQKYDQSIDTFERYYKLEPNNREIAHAYASNLYKLNRFDEAKSIFEILASNAVTGRDVFNSNYDLGNTNFMTENYQEAIKNYERALSVKPDDDKAINNLNLARKRLEEQKEANPTPTPTPSMEQSPSPNDSAKPTPSPQPSPSEDATPSPQDNSDNQEEGDSDQKKDQEEQQAKEEQDRDSGKEEDKNQPSSEPKERSDDESKDLSEKEAKAWLDSLSDEPILLRRQVGRSKSSQDQEW